MLTAGVRASEYRAAPMRYECRTAGRCSLRATLGMSIALAGCVAVRAGAATLPAGFQDGVVASGLVYPTAVAFSPDGRIFVAEKSGLIKVFDGPGDTPPSVFADLRTNVHNFWDRGMSGLALHPNFPATPYVYVTYTLDAPIGGTPPVWGTAGATSDGCPTPPGPTTDGCVVGGRLSRLEASGNTMVNPEHVLIEAWCQQFPSHSVDGVVFGNDGALYVSAGEGSNFDVADYGQFGNPLNPCGDPPVGLGGAQTPPGAEGGALRAQSVQRTPGEPAVLNGTVLRVDPISGQPLPDNPLVGSGIPGAERIIAYGLRNPFRLAPRPGTNEMWIGDVGWNVWEEIDRIADTSDAVVENFGWPCYEGLAPQPSFQAINLDQCRHLYQQVGTVTAPTFAYNHSQTIVDGEPCQTGGSSVSGLAFYQGGSYPSLYDGALFFADYARSCIWTMLPDATGTPDPNQRMNFVIGANAVDLKIGPGGDLYYVDFNTGTVHRVQFFGTNQPPIAVIRSDVRNGALPLTVHFDGSGSSDADPGDTITYAWDLDGDGAFDDSTAVAPQYTYTQAGTIPVRLQVTDSHGLSATATLLITAGNTAPTATITTPLASAQWQVGSLIAFSGTATDHEDGLLPASRLSWSIVMHHCPQNVCHLHPVQSYAGVASGSFNAPDHEYPSFLEVTLTATDSGDLSDTTSVHIYPRTATLAFQTVPAGLALATGSEAPATPFQRSVILGSANTISAPSPQSLDGDDYVFTAWSDGGAPSHTVTAAAGTNTLIATFARTTGGSCGDGTIDFGEECDDGGTVGGDCCSATCLSEGGAGCPARPAYYVGGAIHYYRGDSPVAGTTVTLQGSALPAATTAVAGQYSFSGVTGAAYRIDPHKTGDRRNAVSTLDAAYALQAAAGQRQLDPLQRLAADVDGDGSVTDADALRILQASVGLATPFPAAQFCGSDWLFEPVPATIPHQSLVEPSPAGAMCGRGAIAYTPLASAAIGQDFQAVLFGDCTGNWRPTP